MKKINWNYTIGEILIVIIGITIAFSMNTCAENEKNDRMKIKYLKNLKNDIETDKNNLEENLEMLSLKKETISKSFRYFNPAFPKRDSLLILSFFKTAQVIEFSAKNTTYQTLINSGDLNLIDNFDLKTSIQEHYRKYGRLQQDYERMVNISKKYIADYFIYDIDMEKFRRGETAFQNEKLLKSIIQSMYGALDLKISSTKNSIESCNDILTKINMATK